MTAEHVNRMVSSIFCTVRVTVATVATNKGDATIQATPVSAKTGMVRHTGQRSIADVKLSCSGVNRAANSG